MNRLSPRFARPRYPPEKRHGERTHPCLPIWTSLLRFCVAGFERTNPVGLLQRLVLNQVEAETRRQDMVAGRGFEPLTFGL